MSEGKFYHTDGEFSCWANCKAFVIGSAAPEFYSLADGTLTMYCCCNGIVVSYTTTEESEITDFSENFEAGCYQL